MEAQPRPLGGDQNRASTVLAVFWVPYPILVILIAARLFVRVKIQHLGLDDYFMFLAWIIISVSTSLTSYHLTHGGARHEFYLTTAQIMLASKYSFISQYFVFTSVVFAKSSVALLLLRIIGTVSTWRKRLIYGNFLLYWATTVVIIVVGSVRCSPPRSMWEPVPGSTCRSPNVVASLTIFQGVHGTFIDFLLALIPVTIIRGLQMESKRKIGLCILLGLGFLYGALFTLLKKNAYPKIPRGGIASLMKTIANQNIRAETDLTWARYSLSIWGPVECFIVIICGCIPTLMPLVDFLIKGNPIRPARLRFTNPRGYQIPSSNNDSSRRKITQRFRGWIHVTSDHNSDFHSIPEDDRSTEMHDVPVET